MARFGIGEGEILGGAPQGGYIGDLPPLPQAADGLTGLLMEKRTERTNTNYLAEDLQVTKRNMAVLSEIVRRSSQENGQPVSSARFAEIKDGIYDELFNPKPIVQGVPEHAVKEMTNLFLDQMNALRREVESLKAERAEVVAPVGDVSDGEPVIRPRKSRDKPSAQPASEPSQG